MGHARLFLSELCRVLSERLDLAASLARCVPEIVVHLEFQPKIRRGGEGFGEPKRHLGGDSGFAVEHSRKCDTRDPKMSRSLRNCALAELFPE